MDWLDGIFGRPLPGFGCFTTITFGGLLPVDVPGVWATPVTDIHAMHIAAIVRTCLFNIDINLLNLSRQIYSLIFNDARITAKNGKFGGFGKPLNNKGL